MRRARPPVTTPSDDRSSAAIAYQWASRIMVVALEMVLPGLAGYWLDKQLGTVVLFMLVGFSLGCTAAVIHLVRMTRADEQKQKQSDN
jgi:F0F1-type ATP synthase assembly protein I